MHPVFLVMHSSLLSGVGSQVTLKVKFQGTFDGDSITIAMVVSEPLEFGNLEVQRVLDHYFFLRQDTQVSHAPLEAALFEFIAETYEDAINADENLANINNLLEMAVGPVVLDYGCGTGLSVSAHGSTNLALVGYDKSLSMRSQAQRRGLETVDELSDLGLVDSVLASFVFHLESGRTDLPELVRLVRPGGRIVANFHKSRGMDTVNAELCANGFRRQAAVGFHSAASGPIGCWEKFK